jgi:hypothetical protein
MVVGEVLILAVVFRFRHWRSISVGASQDALNVLKGEDSVNSNLGGKVKGHTDLQRDGADLVGMGDRWQAIGQESPQP